MNTNLILSTYSLLTHEDLPGYAKVRNFVPTAPAALPTRTVSQGGSLLTVTAQAHEWAVPAKPSSRGRHGGSFNFGGYGL